VLENTSGACVNKFGHFLTLLQHLLWYARFPITVRHVDALFLGRGLFAVWVGGRGGSTFPPGKVLLPHIAAVAGNS